MSRDAAVRLAALLVGLLIRRVALLAALLALVFVAIEVLPGDASSSSLERGASAAEVADRRAELGLDQPLALRFLRWMTGLPTGDLGTSARGVAVTELVDTPLPNTLLLGGLALILTVLASVVLGCWAALRPGGLLDRVVTTSSTLVIALPEYVVASVLVLLFALWADLLPAVTVTSESGTPASASMLVLPLLALSIPQIGWNTRLVRAALADEITAPHVEAAIIDGLSLGRIMAHHVLPGALPTVAAATATSVGMLLGGAIVVETIFNYPGAGAVLAGAVTDRDAPLVAGVVAPTAAAIMAVLLVSDVVRAWATGGRP